jgi:hypothetical protein
MLRQAVQHQANPPRDMEATLRQALSARWALWRRDTGATPPRSLKQCISQSQGLDVNRLNNQQFIGQSQGLEII